MHKKLNKHTKNTIVLRKIQESQYIEKKLLKNIVTTYFIELCF